MIQFFKKLFGTKKQNNALIDTLKGDHKNLVNIYTKIHKAVEKNNFAQAQSELKNFVHEYNKHILLEDTQLYIALEEKYKDKKQILKTIRSIGKDMNDITRTITFFEKKYKIINNSNKEEFLAELDNIGEVLVKRVEFEEERLYTLL